MPKPPLHKKQKTIKWSELQRLAFCNSKKLPQLIEQDDGHNHRWVGIGWVDEGRADGKAVKVVE